MLPALGLGQGSTQHHSCTGDWIEAQGKLATKAGSREGDLEQLRSPNLCPLEWVAIFFSRGSSRPRD